MDAFFIVILVILMLLIPLVFLIIMATNRYLTTTDAFLTSFLSLLFTPWMGIIYVQMQTPVRAEKDF